MNRASNRTCFNRTLPLLPLCQDSTLHPCLQGVGEHADEAGAGRARGRVRIEAGLHQLRHRQRALARHPGTHSPGMSCVFG